MIIPFRKKKKKRIYSQLYFALFCWRKNRTKTMLNIEKLFPSFQCLKNITFPLIFNVILCVLYKYTTYSGTPLLKNTNNTDINYIKLIIFLSSIRHSVVYITGITVYDCIAVVTVVETRSYTMLLICRSFLPYPSHTTFLILIA